MLGPVVKDPDGAEVFGFDWEDDLNGDTISASTWTLPSGLTEAASSNTSTTTQLRYTGGADGRKYLLQNNITTAGGATYQRSALVVAMNR